MEGRKEKGEGERRGKEREEERGKEEKEREGGREGDALREKDRKNQSHKLEKKKKPYKIEVHYVFVHFQNVAKLNH